MLYRVVLPVIFSLTCSVGALAQIQRKDPLTPFSLSWIGLLVNSHCKFLSTDESASHAEDARFLQATLVEAHGSSSPLVDELRFAMFTASQPVMRSCGPEAKDLVLQSAERTKRFVGKVREYLQQDRQATLAAMRSEGAPPSPPASSASTLR